MKVAVVHEWFTHWAGSENVVEQILRCFPDADLFSVVDFLPPQQRSRIGGRTAITSFVQRLPFARSRYRTYLSLMPLAVEQFDLSGYDLVVSSSHAVAKGVLTGPGQTHISYVHSPMRYAWDLQHQYLRESRLDRGVKGFFAKWMLHKLRIWDARTANGVDQFVANSRFIAERIWKVYRREATVIYPPVDTETFTPEGSREEFYVCASRMVPYKRMGLIVEAFTALPDRRLMVLGDGPDLPRARKLASENVEFLGSQPVDMLRHYLRKARAFIFAAEEDFGILPVEAQACGTPVIAFGRGGVRESVRGLDDESPTGVFFDRQDVTAIHDAILEFERNQGLISEEACRRNAERFSADRFVREFRAYVHEVMSSSTRS